MRPDIVALQECLGRDRSQAVPDGYRLIGCCASHAPGRFVHLYCKDELVMESLSSPARRPFVIGRTVVNDITVDFVTAHLAPAAEGPSARA